MVDDDENLLGIYFQDKGMCDTFNAFPEVLFVDATHKLNEFRMPLYIFLVEDGNGESDVVGMFLAAKEDASTIEKMIKLFKKYNANWTKISTIMSDKDFNERKVFEKEIPDANLLICLFHVARSFRR